MTEPVLKQKILNGALGQITYFINQRFPDRPTLVFLHGLAANHTTWNNVAIALDKLGLNCLAPDLRGHGLSDKTIKRSLYKLSVFTQDLKEILDKEGLSKIILAGYSYGGFVAQDFVLKYPDRVSSLILISTNHVNPFKYRFYSFLTWPCYYALTLAGWLLWWQKRKKYYYFNQDTDIGYWRSTFRGFLTMPLGINFWMLAEIANIDFSRELFRIACPTLLIRSQRDAFLSPREITDMKNAIKLAEIKTIDEPTHFLASRHQQKTLETIIDFLKEQKII